MLDKRSIAEEQMDAVDLDPETYARVLHDLSRANTVTLNRLPTLNFLKRAAAGMDEFRLLDVGYGAGDMLRAIDRWASAQGIRAELTGIDLNPKSEAVANAATPLGRPIRYLTGDLKSLASEPFDFIISSLVVHHMSVDQLNAFLQFMDQTARKAWLINDLHRHGFAWFGYPLLARLLGWHRIVREDGQLSIERSYRPAEWPPILSAAGVEGARIYRAFPFRLCVEKIR